MQFGTHPTASLSIKQSCKAANVLILRTLTITIYIMLVGEETFKTGNIKYMFYKYLSDSNMTI
jgi:hypothetical protein